MTLSEARIDELLAQARAGDDAATATLIRGVRERVIRWAIVVTGDADDAEDVAQQVSLTLYRKLRYYEGRSRFTTWLYSVVRNAALGLVQQAHRRHETSTPDGERSGGLTAGAEERLAAIEQQQMADVVRSFFSDLAPRQRELIQLVDIDGYSAAEAARMLDIEADTARVHLLRARRALRKRMLALHPEMIG